MYKLNVGGRFAQAQNMINKALDKPETNIGRLDNPFIYQHNPQQPGAGVTSNPLKSEQSPIIANNQPVPAKETNVIQTVPQIVSNNTSEEDYRKMKKELEEMFSEKFSKFDEMLLLMKENSARQCEIQKQVTNNFQPQQLPNLQNMATIIPPSTQVPLINSSIIQQPPMQAANQIKEKQIRTKRTYYPITDIMWTDVKSKFPDLPDENKARTFSDGTDYFIEMQNKKNLIDNKLVLKILNKKNK